MHIPDGYLGPKTFVTCYALAAPFWWRAWSVVRERIRSYEVPHIALAAAFVFVIQMINVPLPGGTTGHAVGASAAAIILGVWPAVLAVSFALLVQALVFGDGGITAFGANALNMAIIQPFVAIAVWNLARPSELRGKPARLSGAAFASGYIGLMAAALATAVQFGIQPALERAADGTPLYCPYPLSVALPAMLIPHLLVGIIEGCVTGFLVAALVRSGQTVITPSSNLMPVPALYRRPIFWVVATVAVLLVPIGIHLPALTGAGDAWGEWAPEEAAAGAGLAEVPRGMARFADFWRAPVPDYAFAEAATSTHESAQYVLAAILGVAIIAAGFAMLGRWQRSRMRALSGGPGDDVAP